MNPMQLSIRWLGLLAISALLLSNIAGSELQEVTSEQLSENIAMPPVGKDQLERILGQYYKDGLGGPEAWEAISSIYITGRLTLKSGEFQLTTYRKKPYYMKRIIANDLHYIESGSNGKTAWQILGKGGFAREMVPMEARRFIYEAQFGNHLLYPFASGKQIEYIDTVPSDGSICHLLQVTLEKGYKIDYFINVHTHLVTKTVTTDLHSKNVYSQEYANYSHEFDIPIAKKIVTYENAEWVSTLEVDQIKVNTGMMPWMFEPKSGSQK